jgi:DNA-binding NtrC family response regulator
MARILIIEDEHLLRWSLVQRLEKVGHSVDTAASLAQAVRRIEQGAPDVVLLDLALPDGHGLDFYEAHRTELGAAVVVVMTAVGKAEDEARASRLGVSEFLTKPVAHQTLVELVEQKVGS